MRGKGLTLGTTISRLTFVALFSVLVACSSAPIQEMSDARQAVQAAKKSGINADNSQLLKLAEDRLKSAELKLKRHWYQSAREDAVLARDVAVKARTEDKLLEE